MSIGYAALARALGPETALLVGAILVLTVDLAWLRRASLQRRTDVAAAIGGFACLAALALGGMTGAVGEVFGGVLILDSVAVATRAALLVLTLLTLGIAQGAAPSRHPAEFVALMLLGSVGLLVMPAAQQLLLAFAALELTSLSLYVLVGFDKTRADSAEAALKYYLVGGVSAAFLLFGFSLIYGTTGTLMFGEIAPALFEMELSPLVAVALVMVVVALGFKVAAAPFHLWAPDAYQGAPAPSAALVASGSKLAAIVLFYRLLWPGMYPVSGMIDQLRGMNAGWQVVVLVVAVAAMLLGNLVALAQTNVRRLLAYSAIAHAGIMLLALIVAGPFGVGALVYYAVTYGVATVGVFGVVAVLDRSGGCQSIGDLAGLWRRSPLLASSLFVFLLSLAGIPPLAGFFAKFNVFLLGIREGGLGGPVGWATVLAIALSAVGLYYYLIVLKQAFVAPAREGAERVHVSFASATAILVAAGGTILLGVFPWLLLDAF